MNWQDKTTLKDENSPKNEIKEYYQCLQRNLEDRRDNRGKKHELALTLLLMIYAMLHTEKQVNIAYIHRLMKDYREEVASIIGKKVKRCVSYSQLKRILRTLDYKKLNEINARFLGIALEKVEDGWYSIDGKELRGSIDGVLGEKRGENLISVTRHRDGQSKVVGFYHGKKDSEKTVVKEYMKDLQGKECGVKYSLDALHLSKGLVEEMESKGLKYLIQVKDNQKVLKEECAHVFEHLPSEHQHEKIEKAHGRIEKRVGHGYQMNLESLPEDWTNTGLKSLMVIERSRRVNKSQKESQEISYWVSNIVLDTKSSRELFEAIRGHWTIESCHYQRDMQIGEDKIKTKHEVETRSIASCSTFVLNLWKTGDEDNLSILREKLARKKVNVISLFNNL